MERVFTGGIKMKFFSDMSPLGKIFTGVCCIAAAPAVVALSVPVCAAVGGIAVSVGASTAAVVSAGVAAATAAGEAAAAIGAAAVAAGVSEAV